jgi:hypothetical protein
MKFWSRIQAMDQNNADHKPVEKGVPYTDISWKFLGLQIDRKTEFIALAAFILSFSSVLWQVINFARGAVVRLFPSDQILMTNTDKLGRGYSDQGNYLALIATMSYVNEGDTGHNAIVRREWIRFVLPDRTVEHRWYEIVSSDMQENKLVIKRESEARPFPVNAGSSTSHETLFAAWEISCEANQKGCNPAENFVKWDSFVEKLKETRTIVFTTSADIYSGGSMSASCKVNLRDWEIEYLEKDQFFAATCTDSGATRETHKPQLPRRAAPAR